MHNKGNVIFNKKLLYEYNICLYILEESCDKGIIDVFKMTEAIILLRKKYKMPVISIYDKKVIIPATKKLGEELIKEAYYSNFCNSNNNLTINNFFEYFLK